MHGMKRTDAGNYIEMVCREENVQFSYPAQQALIATALNSGIGGINAFTTIIGRCITLARVHYYNLPGHSIPDKAKCVRTEVPGGAAYPGAKLILTLPVTSDPVHISEQMVSDMQSEYKSLPEDGFIQATESPHRQCLTGRCSKWKYGHPNLTIS